MAEAILKLADNTDLEVDVVDNPNETKYVYFAVNYGGLKYFRAYLLKFGLGEVYWSDKPGVHDHYQRDTWSPDRLRWQAEAIGEAAFKQLMH